MSNSFTITTERDPFWPGDVITLRDFAAESWAKLLPEAGCNLVGFGAVVDRRHVETFLQPLDERPARAPEQYGAPVLFPFPNRLRGGQAAFGGKAIAVDRAPGAPHAIHGLVRHRRWDVDELSTAAGAQARCSVVADVDTLRQFPFPFRLTLTFQLRGPSLRVVVEAENTGDAPMPLGFGWHPYFRLPLVPGGDRAANLAQIPARRQWQLNDTLVPTGETKALPPDRDFQRARPLGAATLDDVYTDLVRDGQTSRCSLSDPGSGRSLRIAAGPTFREWVVYAPPTRPTICFEPYTCPTDAFNLAERGLDVGLIVLPPGGRWSDWIELSIH
jgi:aldose 1-epimerase